jgi:hypothetical protein
MGVNQGTLIKGPSDYLEDFLFLRVLLDREDREDREDR